MICVGEAVEIPEVSLMGGTVHRANGHAGGGVEQASVGGKGHGGSEVGGRCAGGHVGGLFGDISGEGGGGVSGNIGTG